MIKKYNCPKCGEVPRIAFNYANNKISCCDIFIEGSSTLVCISRWKKACRLVGKEYKFDSHGLPIVNLDIPMPIGNPPRKP